MKSDVFLKEFFDEGELARQKYEARETPSITRKIHKKGSFPIQVIVLY